MSTALIASLVAVFCALIAIFAARRSGPRVTHIETRHTSDEAEK